jgi:hypothetical protein
MSGDLTDFERRRLDNIQRNEAFLSSLGLGAIKSKIAAYAPPTKKEKKPQQSPSKKRPRSEGRGERFLVREQPTRCSQRLRRQPDARAVEEAEEAEVVVVMEKQKTNEFPQVCLTNRY